MNIILGEHSEQAENSINNQIRTNNKLNPNLFQGKTDAEIDEAKFPNWDIMPPSQFINPRIKKH
ncbi:hypothetical protein [Pedobacter nototheniae]|uniref:hypothetical protein n=1 Tax=Pedobacter nototheniae TaxID=2488994 RepID=UPI00103E92DC|nr:hypothetical protein [Pedobacter nototheniae]